MSNLLANRGEIEGLVISCLLQDMSLVADVSFTEKDFKFPKTKFFFNLIRELSKRYSEIDEVTTSVFVGTSPTLKDSYEQNGGWNSVKNAISLGSIKNFEKYTDDLEKSNLLFKLEENGFNIEKEIEIEGNSIRPIDLFPSMTSNQVYDFYEMLLADMSIKSLGDEIKKEVLYFTDKEINSIENQELDNSASYGITLRWEDEEGNEKYIPSFRMLDSVTNGYSHSNGVHIIGGHSGTGKTTITTNIAMGLVESGCKCLIISNEQQSLYFKNILMSYICHQVFKCYSIDRKKISSGNFTEEEREIFIKANNFIKEKYGNNLTFISVNEFNVAKICKVAKKLNLAEGYDTLILDTFKPENAANSNSHGEMNENARELDRFGRQMGMRVILPSQCRTSNEGKVSYMTSAELASSKQIKEVAASIILVRKIIDDELDPSKDRFFLKPYKWGVNRLTGRPEKKYLEIIDSSKAEDRAKEYDTNCIDRNKSYVLVFLNKNRSGESDLVWLYEIDGRSGKVTERASCDYVYKGQLSY